MLRAFLLAAALVLSSDVSPARADLKGDAAAIARARRMIDQMGDRQAWATARWIYTAERAFYASRPDSVEVAFWRATTVPAEWGRIATTGLHRVYAWTAGGGWRHENDQRRPFTRDEMQERLGWWPGEIYVMYHRLAKEDDGLRLVSSGDRSFTVLDDATGTHLGLFEVAASGELVRWTHFYGTDRVEYIYGPLKQFGAIRMPDWGALTDGDFRFYYTEVRLRREPEAPVPLEPPPP
jgi:hypothetical protein